MDYEHLLYERKGPVALITIDRPDGFRRAMELIVTGRVIDAEEALAIGLVNEVVPRGACVEGALRFNERDHPDLVR